MYIIKMTDILSMPVISLECQWAVTHATRGRDGRQEGRECGYYHLHRHLNNPIRLHNSSLFLRSFSNGAGVTHGDWHYVWRLDVTLVPVPGVSPRRPNPCRGRRRHYRR